MSKTTATPDAEEQLATVEDPLSTKRILRAFTGCFVAGTMALLFAKMLMAIATTFANKPIISDNPTVLNLSAAVRTLVLGTIALGTGVFGMAAIGLMLLGFQMIGKRLKGSGNTPPRPVNE
ncbi:MAG: DUF3082 domain-containing protein [Cyanobacteria bacterium P01_H01_bin.58]